MSCRLARPGKWSVHRWRIVRWCRDIIVRIRIVIATRRVVLSSICFNLIPIPFGVVARQAPASHAMHVRECDVVDAELATVIDPAPRQLDAHLAPTSERYALITH